MRHKKNFDNDPVTDFMRLMREELKSEPGLHLRVERIPQGLMANHLTDYIPVNQIELQQGIEPQIKRRFHGGCYNLTLADIELEPLENVKSLWINIAGDMRSGIEKRRTRAEEKLAGAMIEHKLEEQKNTTKQRNDLLEFVQKTMANFFAENNRLSLKLFSIMIQGKGRHDNEQQKQKAIWEFFTLVEIMKMKQQNKIAEKNKKQYEELDQILKNMGGSH